MVLWCHFRILTSTVPIMERCAVFLHSCSTQESTEPLKGYIMGREKIWDGRKMYISMLLRSFPNVLRYSEKLCVRSQTQKFFRANAKFLGGTQNLHWNIFSFPCPFRGSLRKRHGFETTWGYFFFLFFFFEWTIPLKLKAIILNSACFSLWNWLISSAKVTYKFWSCYSKLVRFRSHHVIFLLVLYHLWRSCRSCAHVFPVVVLK